MLTALFLLAGGRGVSDSRLPREKFSGLPLLARRSVATNDKPAEKRDCDDKYDDRESNTQSHNCSLMPEVKKQERTLPKADRLCKCYHAKSGILLTDHCLDNCFRHKGKEYCRYVEHITADKDSYSGSAVSQHKAELLPLVFALALQAPVNLHRAASSA
ncbi:hypothetical protein ACP3S7_25200 [Phytobacter ursingii]